MSVMIRGMNMPKVEDEFVEVSIFGDGKVIQTGKSWRCKEDGKCYYESITPELFYRATEISEPHGRLIDADELYAFAGTIVTNKTDRDVALDCKVKAASMLREFIRRAPTIIPASEDASHQQVIAKWYKPTGMMPPEFAGRHRCSACDGFAMHDWKHHREQLTPFCPHCGAKMENGDSEL